MFVDLKSVGLVNFCRCQLSKASRADLLHMSSAGHLLSPIEFFNGCRCQFRGVPECLSMSATLSFSDRLASCKSCRPPTVSDRVLQCLSMSNLWGSSMFVDVNDPMLLGSICFIQAPSATYCFQLSSSMFVDANPVWFLNVCRCQLSRASRTDWPV